MAIGDKLKELERDVDETAGTLGRMTILLQHTARKAPSQGGREWYDVEVFLAGQRKVLDQVSHVEYHLHPTFSPSTVRKDRPQLNLRLRVWGEFTIRATVHFESGPPVELARFLSLPG